MLVNKSKFSHNILYLKVSLVIYSEPIMVSIVLFLAYLLLLWIIKVSLVIAYSIWK